MGIWIGIDAGEHCGFAVWDSEAKAWVELCTCDVIQCLLKLTHYGVFKRLKKVIIEDPSGNRPVFSEKYRGAGGKPITVNAMLKIAQNIGANKRDAEIIRLWCEHHSIPYEMAVPTSKTHKWNEEYFQQLTKVKIKTSQHCRDGARLVFGR